MVVARTLGIVLVVALQGFPAGVLHLCRMDAAESRVGCACAHGAAQAQMAAPAPSTSTVRADRCCDVQTPSVTAAVGRIDAHSETTIALPQAVAIAAPAAAEAGTAAPPLELRPELLPQGPPIWVAVRSLLI